MASVFLSYARADAAKANRLAEALRRSGHDVWWDRQIQGGARYSKEIKSALDRAHVVLVLWSEQSVESDWVQDEAEVGRDSGRLVPVAIEPVEPPLGFRQIQTIELVRWKGRSAPRDLLEAIETLSGSTREVGKRKQLPTDWTHGLPRSAWLALAAIAALVAIFGVWQLARDRIDGGAEMPTLAVLPFADLSPEGDKAYFSEGVGEAILSLLSREPGMKVIGRSSSAQFRPGEADFREIRKALGVTHFLEGSARTAGEELRMSVRLIDTRDGAQVWAEDYQRQLKNIFTVQDEIGRAVAERLKGTLVSPGTVRQQTTAADVYTLYLALRAKMRTREPQQLAEALDLARRINEADPTYAPAYAARAELIWLLSTENYGTVPVDLATQRALPLAKRAIELSPDAAEGYTALGLLLNRHDPAAAVAPLSRAIALDPSRAEIRLWRARSYMWLGRDEEALGDFRRVVEMEPLWGVAHINLVADLATAGRHREADAVIAEFERRGGDPGWAAWLRSANAFHGGDLSETVRNFLEAKKHGLAIPHVDEFLTWMLHLASLDEAAAGRISARQPVYTRLFLTGRRDALLKETAGAGPEIWELNDADVPIQALTSARHWGRLASLYDRRPSFVSACPDHAGDAVAGQRRASGTIALNVAQALIATGRREEASRLLACVEERLSKLTTQHVRPSGFGDGMVAFMRAQIHALRGRPAEAVRALDQAVDKGWLVLYGGNLRDYPAFDSLPQQDLQRIQTKLDRHIARERAEIQRFCPSCR